MDQIHLLPGPLQGRTTVPADKSITHRALLFGAIADGVSRVRNPLRSGDTLTTLDVVRRLGVEVKATDAGEWLVHGQGLRGLREPEEVLDCRNSGTTARLLLGLLGGQDFFSVLAGSPQLRKRPMGRVTAPLRQMGAQIIGRDGGRLLPLAVIGSPLRGIEYDLPVASAQVKSALLLAGLYARGLTVVKEPGPARDHTERMLGSMGAPILRQGPYISSEQPADELTPLDITVPGDFSSAAFLLAAGAILPDSDIHIQAVGVNPTRRGLLDALIAMGADVTLENERESGGEPVGDLHIRHGELQAITIAGEQVVTMIDELPVFAVIATQARGETIVRDAGELRVKETDRIATTVAELRKLGADIEALPDGFIVRGPTPLKAAHVWSHGDHRLAMALTIAGLAAEGSTIVEDVACASDSFPGFIDVLRRLGASIDETDVIP